MNLYLPDALKAEMDGLDGTNWSQVAQHAFRQTVEIERIRQVNVTEASLERLRKSRETKDERDLADGEAAGKKWALEFAEYDELERVAALDVDPDHWAGEPDSFAWVRPIVDAIVGDDAGRDEYEAFGEKHFGAAYPSAEQCRGFIIGAAEILDAV